jgi:transcriptional regulator with XRE-family HTH domain
MDAFEYSDFLKELGNRIKQRRINKGLSRRDMVVKYGYHDSQWRKYEYGGSITLICLIGVAETLEISLSDLLEGLGKFSSQSAAAIEPENHHKVSAKKPAKKSRLKPALRESSMTG